MTSLARRSQLPELMDGDDVSQADFAACMADLARVNTLTLARRPTLAFIDHALRATAPGRILTIADVGFGAGDMLIAVEALARRRGRKVRLVGYDINPRSEPIARARAGPHSRIEWRTGDVFAWPQDEPLDLVISSLVTHHMSDDHIAGFMQWMEARAQLGWLVNDLHRHWFAFHGFRLLASVMRWHRFVRHDGPLSVARAFRRADWEALLARAGIAENAQIRWWFPFRYCVERPRW